ncbi:MAG: hypothetical protein KJN71_05365 [Acidimicrobiia bacterium]|nr:hypothetical protein [Acidimicrobiia bacterium]NNC74999.1 hypothetical protein [Acidimicrobiia bacterium]
MTTSPAAAPFPVRRRSGRANPSAAPTRRSLHPFIVFTAAVVAAFFAVILIRTSLDTAAFRLDELNAQIEAEESRHWELRLEIARLQAPDRIESAASAMGMVYPEDRSILAVAGVGEFEGADPDERWGELKSLLSAQP